MDPQVEELMAQINLDVNKVKDNLITAKAFQAHHANISHGIEIIYNVGDHIMLSTVHQWREYWKKGDKWAANFFPTVG